VVTHEIVQVTGERVTDVGTGRGRARYRPDADPRRGGRGHRVPGRLEHLEPRRFLFNLADPRNTVRAVSESAMRDIIARSELSPILNRDRGAIAADLRQAAQGTLDSYGRASTSSGSTSTRPTRRAR
jgi:modulator of FtsH protease HflK